MPFSLRTQFVLAQESYTIDRVDHEIEVLYSGHVVIRDTVHLSGRLTGDFLIGFPYKYGSYVLKGVAYDGDTVFPLSLAVQLEDRTGFYGAKVSFPDGAPQVFTVVFVLSNSLVRLDLDGGVYSLDFPAYPSFTRDVARCAVSLVLPEEPSSVTVVKDDGDVGGGSFVKENLGAFTYSPAVASFSLSRGSLQVVTVRELSRRIEISPVGGVVAFDSYFVTNSGVGSLGFLKVGLPFDASDVVVRDEFGRGLAGDVLSGVGGTRFVNVTFISSVASGVSTSLVVEYSLPSVSERVPFFRLGFVLFPDFDYFVDVVRVTFVPPEGARFVEPGFLGVDVSSSLVREVFQESFSVSRFGVSKVDSVFSEDVVVVAFVYSPLWLSFRPALWVWVLAVFGCVVVFVWRRRGVSVSFGGGVSEVSVVSSDVVRAFVEAYDERGRLVSELRGLEERAQKGRVLRRRYKVQRRGLEVRLENVSRSIGDLKRVFRGAGGVYAGLVRQLDVAEAELVEVEGGLRAIEVRHRKGELPLEGYKRSLADYLRRKERVEASISGILLRFREELR